jgi:uncharacterized Zn-binding protein involved in type VI secretion
MPGFILHQGALVLCTHAGPAQPALAEARVRVGGQPVVTLAGQHLISGCGLAAGGSPPCVTAQWVSASTRVLAGGVPVLLQDSQAVCAPTGTGLSIISTQTRVKGI